MAKIIMTLVIPDSKVRKPQAKAVRKHKDKTKYTRKAKHKAPEWGPCAAEFRRAFHGLRSAFAMFPERRRRDKRIPRASEQFLYEIARWRRERTPAPSKRKNHAFSAQCGQLRF